MFTLTTFIQYSIGSSSHSKRQEREIKGIQIGKKEVKLSLFVGDITLYMENTKDASKKSIRINEFSKIQN